MSDEKPKRPIRLWRLWPLVAFAALIIWEVTEANVQGRAIQWEWIAIAIAGSILVLILRVGMRI